MLPVGHAFEIPQAALTIWNIQSSYGTQRLIVDMYLEIVPTDKQKAVRGLDLLLPFDLSEDQKDIEDLSEFLDGAKRSLIPHWVLDPEITGTASQPRSSLPVGIKSEAAKVDVAGRHRIASPIRNKSDVWSRVSLSFDPPADGSPFAIFARFHVGTQSSCVLWKRSLFGVNGLIVDITLSDDDPSEIIPAKIQLCAVMRATLQPHFTVPRAIDPQIIQHGEWTRYLRRKTDRRSEAALIAYIRRSANPKEHRLYLDLSREFGLLPFGNFVRIFLVALLAWLVAYTLVSNKWEGAAPALVDALQRGGSWIWTDVLNRAEFSLALGFKLGGILAVIAFVVLVISRRSKAVVPGIVRPIRLAVARFDRKRQRKQVER